MPVSNYVQSDYLCLPVRKPSSLLSHILLMPSFSRHGYNFGVKASDGAFQEFVRHVSKMPKASEFNGIKRFLYGAYNRFYQRCV